MLTYYLDLGFRSFKSARGLTALMLLSIAMGVAACMTTLTVFHVLSGDPIPGKSDKLFNVQLDAEPLREYQPQGEPELQLTRFDAEALLREKRGVHQVMMTGAFIAVDPEGSQSPASAGTSPFFARARYSTADFFTMFETPFLYGAGWSAAEDVAEARVAVISRDLSEQLFGPRRFARQDAAPARQGLPRHRRDEGLAPGPAFLRPDAGRLHRGRAGADSLFDGDRAEVRLLRHLRLLGRRHRRRHARAQRPLRLDPVLGAARHAAAAARLPRLPGPPLGAAACRRPLRAPGEPAAAQRDGVAGRAPGRAQRRPPAGLAGLRLPARLPDQRGRPAAGQMPAPLGRDRRAPRARRLRAGRSSRSSWSRPAGSA